MSRRNCQIIRHLEGSPPQAYVQAPSPRNVVRKRPTDEGALRKNEGSVRMSGGLGGRGVDSVTHDDTGQAEHSTKL